MPLLNSRCVTAAVAVAASVLVGVPAAPTQAAQYPEVRNQAVFRFGYDVPGLVVEEASIGSMTDALDGAMGFEVDFDPYEPSRVRVDRDRDRLDAGPDGLGSQLRATANYVAIPRTTTLRVLVRLRNVSDRRVADRITWSGNLGSGSNTEIEETSSGDLRFGRGDRWVLTSEENDEDDGNRDPVVTQVFAGPGARSGIESGFVSISADSEVRAVLPLRVPAGATRYVLVYLMVDRTTARAARAVPVFDERRPPRRLLAGLGAGVRSKIVNWRL